jgi:peptidoglycan/LPS O-acetylase OafA/YrhL
MRAKAISAAAPAGNNFDVLRLLLAICVFVVHASKISVAPEIAWVGDSLSSEMAVKAFFVISGFLIVKSFDQSPNLAGYAKNRFLRIYPAYACVIVGAVLLGFALTTLTARQYFSLDALKYLFWNLLFLNFLAPILPGVFADNPVPVVNGALWSLKIEVMFYLAVPLLLWARKRWPDFPLLAVLFVASVLYSIALTEFAIQTDRRVFMELQRQLPGQLAFFIVGAAAYFHWPIFRKYAWPLMLCACVAYVGNGYCNWQWVWWALEPLALGGIILYLALVFPRVGNVAKYGDFSYGIYVIHFPILQTFIAFGFFADSPWWALFQAACVVALGACAMWYCIEQPSLRHRQFARQRLIA